MTVLEWRHQAACQGVDAELFHPLNERGHSNKVRVEQAKTVCARCPVTATCLNWALTIGDGWAILGGTTPEERRAMPRPRRNVDDGSWRVCGADDCDADFQPGRVDQVYCGDRCRRRANAHEGRNPSFTHGVSGYRNHGCRCTQCKDGNRQAQRRLRQRNEGRTPPTHGLSGYKNYSCRCEVCTEANREQQRAYQAGRHREQVPA